MVLLGHILPSMDISCYCCDSDGDSQKDGFQMLNAVHLFQLYTVRVALPLLLTMNFHCCHYSINIYIVTL